MNRDLYDAAGQAARRQEILSRIAELAAQNMGEDLFWPDMFKGCPRENYTRNAFAQQMRGWLASAFVNAGRTDLYPCANEIWRRMFREERLAGSFSVRTLIPTLLTHPEAIAEDVQEIFRTVIARHCRKILSDNVAYQGINDNFPSMDMACGILGGELVGDADAYAKGLRLLSQLEGMFSRRGLASEYTSPTYLCIALSPVADVAEYASDSEIRRRALLCEERMLLDLCAHYHAETCQLAGPNSRTYLVDCAGHTGGARQLFYLLFGDRSPVNITNTLLTRWGGAEGELIHNSYAYMISELASHARSVYHLPVYLADLALKKRYPFRFSATTECRDRIDIAPEPKILYPGGKSAVHTYMTENYAVGFGDADFSSGVQTNLAQLIYRRRPVTSQRDISTLFCKYNINDLPIGEAHTYPCGFHSASEHYLDQGRKLGISQDNTGILLYKPKIWGCEGCTSLALDIILPCIYGMPEEISVNAQPIKLCRGELYAGEAHPLRISDGPVQIGLVPLVFDNHGRDVAMRIRTVGDFLVISLYNYEGEARAFTEEELHCTRNGFILEVRDSAECAPADMEALLASWRFESHMRSYDNFPTMCDAKFDRPGLSFAISYSPISEMVMYRTVNGIDAPEPVLSCDGIDTASLPFASDRWVK
ncbi:MAG: hypothetical protein IKL89_02910 [Clostridia bacterium]|nr:hypothetical protein [Clostridia bacterium]